MKLTTLCHIEKDGCYLMMFRNKKSQDVNGGKWVGVGGKVEPGETPDMCVAREVKEETGLTLDGFTLCGKVEFISDEWDDELIYLYTADSFSGKLIPTADSDRAYTGTGDTPHLQMLATPAYTSSEGELHWVPKNKLMSLPMWAGDRYFLERIIAGDTNIDMTLRYEGETLVEVTNN